LTSVYRLRGATNIDEADNFCVDFLLGLHNHTLFHQSSYILHVLHNNYVSEIWRL